MQKVLVEQSKYGDAYYAADTKEQVARAAYTILKKRFENGWYYEDREEPEFYSNVKALCEMDIEDAIKVTENGPLWLLDLRRDYEYEDYYTMNVYTP